MSLNLNKVILAGRLTAAPELKLTPNGTPVTTFTIAVDRKTAKDTEKKTDFISIVAWRRTAEFITRYFSKGSSICIVGSIQTRSWQDQNGNKRYATEVNAEEANFVDSKSSGEGQNSPNTAVATADTPQFEELSPGEELPF